MSGTAAKPIYILHGEDTFLRDVHHREILAHALEGADPQTCLNTYDASVELAEVLDELRTLPFLAPRRVVIIRDADAFISKYRGQLEDYLQSPPQTATLVLMVSSWPKTTRLFKLVAKVGQVYDCGKPQRGVEQWVANSMGKRGKKIARDAVDLLIAWIGNDLGILDGEIEKLSIYVSSRDTILAEDVSTLVTATAGAGMFALTNAITEGNTASALKALDGMLTTRGEEFRVLGIIAAHLRKALRAQQAVASGKSPDLRMPYSAKNAFLAMLKRRDLNTMQKDFRKLIRADLGMKSGLKASSALQELIVGLCE